MKKKQKKKNNKNKLNYIQLERKTTKKKNISKLQGGRELSVENKI